MIVDRLITSFEADPTKYAAGASAVSAANMGIAGTSTAASTAIAGLQAVSAPAGIVMGTLAAAILATVAAAAAVASAVTAATAGLGALLIGATQAAGSLEALQAAMATSAGSAAELEANMARVRNIAKLPGLGLQEAASGVASLMGAGFDFTLAERAMIGFGNALASVGKGREDLQGVLLALSQIASKGVVSAEEINQIAERAPQIRQLMGAAFGTANTEQLQKMGITAEQFITGIIDQLEQLPRAASTFQNSLENLGDAAYQAMASLGGGIAEAAIPQLEKLSNYFTYLADSGILDRIGQGFGAALGLSGGGSIAVKIASLLVAALEQLPRVMQGMALAVASIVAAGSILIRQAVNAYNSFATSPVGTMLGMQVITAGLQDMSELPGVKDIIQAGQDILTRAGEIEAGFNNSTPTVMAPGQGGSIRTPGGGPGAAGAADGNGAAGAADGNVSAAGIIGGESLTVEPSPEVQAQTRILGNIERNTRPEFGGAEAFGGGRLGALGVTPVELAGMGRRGGSRFAAQLADLIGNEMARQVDQRVADMMRYGALRTS